MYTAYAYLGLYFDSPADEVVKHLQCETSYVSSKHSKNPERGIPVCSIIRVGNVELESESGYLDLFELVAKVVDGLEGHTEHLLDLKSRFDIGFQLNVVSDLPTDENIPTPSIGLNSKEIAFLHVLGANIDYDTYKA